VNVGNNQKVIFDLSLRVYMLSSELTVFYKFLYVDLLPPCFILLIICRHIYGAMLDKRNAFVVV
jgi:hypothetical protein